MPISQRALLACLMIGFANGYISAFIVLRRSALRVGTISHGLLPGIALAVMLFGLSQWSVLVGAVAAGLFVGLGSLLLSQRSRVDQDTALGILYTAGFAGGLIIISRLGIRQKLDEWLFGGLMGMSDADLWIAFAISTLAVLVLTAYQRSILLMLFEPNIAASVGIPVKSLTYTLFSVVILTLVSSLQAVGCILSIGLLVAPAATIALFSKDASKLFLGGGILGAVGACSGFILSYYLDWPAGSAIVFLLGTVFLIGFIVPSNLFRSRN
ncbi:MAG: metal ABC transporter permease [Verrucomicrobiae bacterium]|nr:metal ABC transporter permease [Verrucomicrobiae bacterium]